MDHIMDIRFELQYKAVTEFKCMKLCFPVYKQLSILSVLIVSWQPAGFTGSQMVNTPQLSMSIATMEGKIVDVNARSWDSNFPEHR